VETIASFALLAILMSAIAILVRNAMLMTNTSIHNARNAQENEVNPAMMEEYGGFDLMDITFDVFLGVNLIASSTHEVKFNTFCAAFPACVQCANAPFCVVMPCPTCCGCNDEIAFTPEVP